MIENCRDFRRIKRLSKWAIDISQVCHYLVEVKDGEDLGVWLVHPYEDGVMIHVNLGDKCRGKAAAASARNAFDWIFKHIGVNMIYASISNDKRHVQMLACAVGFVRFYEEELFRVYKLKAA